MIRDWTGDRGDGSLRREAGKGWATAREGRGEEGQRNARQSVIRCAGGRPSPSLDTLPGGDGWPPAAPASGGTGSCQGSSRWGARLPEIGGGGPDKMRSSFSRSGDGWRDGTY